LEGSYLWRLLSLVWEDFCKNCCASEQVALVVDKVSVSFRPEVDIEVSVLTRPT